MSSTEIRIVKLNEMRVASVLGYGPQPEDQAWKKLIAWAQPLGLMDTAPQIFGFNNPSPSPGSPNYGYELMIVVSPDLEVGGDVEIKTFPGGLYAVARCEVTADPGEQIPAAWRSLVLWREQSRYQGASHQWLEEHIETAHLPEGQFTLDLYLPIAE
ncbi:MAG: GyrI-like domain-containing protein [Anaerolineales bacterium]|nr:GyrI-like domain-containing protein [Anaerolineales bacterium]